MQRTISSAQTALCKFVYPVIWFLILGFWMLGLLLSGGPSADAGREPTQPGMIWFFLIALLWRAYAYWFGMRLKKVSRTDNALFIYNCQKEIQVPLRDIAAVFENRWIHIQPVSIEFRHPTDFGDRIVFMPTIRFFALWSSHPIAAELREVAPRASGDDASQSTL